MKLRKGAMDAEEMVDLAFVLSGWPLITVIDLYAVLGDWDVTPTDEEAGSVEDARVPTSRTSLWKDGSAAVNTALSWVALKIAGRALLVVGMPLVAVIEA